MPTDLELGNRRARAAALLTGALPGSLYVYQGDELGLPEVEDLPVSALQDPVFRRSEGTDPGRDGCRVPLPWTSAGPSFGFSHGSAAAAWLPQPPSWSEYTVERQEQDPASMLRLYRTMLGLRRHTPALRGEKFAWIETPDEVLGFRRGDDLVCLINFGAAPCPLPGHVAVLCASGDLDGGTLPADTAVWLAVSV